jgi:hypothetical protein
MKIHTILVGLLGAAAIVASGVGTVVRANGAEFFEAENDGKIVLFYAGNVRDSKGNALDKVTITIVAKNADLTFPFRTDQPGHYRSIDVGKMIEGAGKKVDPSQITISASKPDYKLVSVPKIPNKMGSVQLEPIIMELVPGAGKKK